MTFNSAVARISCAQICRSNGIDRCTHGALESLSDIMTRFLELLATTAMQAAQVKARGECELEDAVYALENHHVIGGHLDGADAEGVLELIQWLRGPAAQRALQVSKIQQQTLSALGQAQGAAIAAQQGANEMQGTVAKVDLQADWLRQMVNKQVLMGHGHKYRNTMFGEPQAPFTEVGGSEYMPKGLAERLGVGEAAAGAAGAAGEGAAGEGVGESAAGEAGAATDPAQNVIQT